MLGDGIFEVALAFAVLDATGSAAALGIVLACSTVPLAAFVLLAGVVADRLPRRRILIAADLVRACTQGGLAVLVSTGHAGLWSLALLAALSGTSFAFFLPASLAFVPEVADDDELPAVNGVGQALANVTWIAGGALGGLLVAAAGPGLAIGLDALTFVASALAIAAIRPRRSAVLDRTRGRSTARLLREGWSEVRGRPWLWSIMLFYAFELMLYLAPFGVVGPIVAERELGGPAAWGLITASLAIGALAGGLLVARGSVRRPMVVAGVAFALGATTPLLVAIAAPVAAIATTHALTGLAFGLEGPLWATALQTRVPADRRSRVAAWDGLVTTAGMPLGFALAAPLAGSAGTDATLVVLAAVGLAGGAFLLGSRAARSLEAAARPEPAAAERA